MCLLCHDTFGPSKILHHVYHTAFQCDLRKFLFPQIKTAREYGIMDIDLVSFLAVLDAAAAKNQEVLDKYDSSNEESVRTMNAELEKYESDGVARGKQIMLTTIIRGLVAGEININKLLVELEYPS